MPSKDCKSALGAAMAASTAHGVSHAAATQRTPLKIMWALLFVVFLGFFFSSSSHLVENLWNRALVKSFELDKVPFVFPDLYFCPSDPYSGSYPYSLTREEADLVNSEISRLIDRCYNISMCRKTFPSRYLASTLSKGILSSLPVSLSMKYLTHRKEQSVLSASMRLPTQEINVKIETFSDPQKTLCFKLALTDEMRRHLTRKDVFLELWLSTDPQFSNFEYPGFSIMDLDVGGKSMKWFEWHSRAASGLLKKSGYSMLVVPPGVYPSPDTEHIVHLAPGNFYNLRISMEENTFGDSLIGTKCFPNHPTVAIRDDLTFDRVEFNYSYGYCWMNELAKFSVNSVGLHTLLVPVPWESRNIPRFLNLTEMTESLYEQARKKFGEFFTKLADEEPQISQDCRKKQPCKFLRYSTEFSFEKWPSIGSAAEGILEDLEYKTRVTEKTTPALMKMQKSAKLAMAENHSSHAESVFRTYVSESLLSMKISGSSSTAPLVTTDWSYSFTAFLADTGGVLGLYIGCSMLTLFEVVEIFWTMCEGLFCRSRRQPSENGEREAAGETEAAL